MLTESKGLKWLLLFNAASLIGSGGAALYVFIRIWQLQYVSVCEDIIWVRTIETIVAATFVLFGLGTVAYWARRYLRWRE